MKGLYIRVRNLRALLALCVSIPFFAYAADTGVTDVRALWVALPQSVLKISPVDGSVGLQLNGTPSPQGFAVDETDETVWIYGHRALESFDAQGNPLLNVQLPGDFDDDAPAGMAVDNSAGNVWIAINQHLYRLDMGGSVQSVIHLADEAQAISLDASKSQLWVAEEHGIEIFGSGGNTVGVFSLGHGFQPEAVAYDSFLKQAWLLSDESLERVNATGQVLLQARIPGDLGAHLAPDGQGGLWAAGGRTLAYLDQTGAAQFNLNPFDTDGHDSGDGDHGELVDLVADPLNHTAWVAGAATLEQFGTDGTLKQTITVPGQQRHDGGHDDDDSGVRHVALYVDTTPPTVTITAPANGAYTNQNKPALTLSYSDIGSGVDPKSIAVTSNGANLPVTCQANADNTGASCTPNTVLPDGGYSLSVTVKDLAGNVSQPATGTFTVETVPPVITISSPTGTVFTQSALTIAGSLSQAGTLTINGNGVEVSASNTFSAAETLSPGSNSFTFVATDLAGNATTLTQTYIYAVAPVMPVLSLISIGNPVDGEATVTGQSGAVGANDVVVITDTKTGQSVTTIANAQGGFSATVPSSWGDPITVVAENPADTAQQSPPANTQAGSIPPAPVTTATTLTPTGVTPFVQGTAFLYSGSSPVQFGVAANNIQPAHVAVIRGTVEDTQGNPLSGAVITVLNHPEFGYTVSRSDGMFDMAVNGGQTYVVAYNKTGYLPVQRQVKSPWRDYAWAKTVSLTQPSAQVSAVAFGSAAPQFVSGATTSDANGARTPSLFIPAGTTATMTLSNGAQAPLANAHLRMTEFTVGPNGQQAMPGELPQYSAYTYALDFQLDEATQQQAVQTVFSSPVFGYVTNFLNVPVGAYVPSGSYDKIAAQWVPSDNGIVIRILGADANGQALLDVSGQGQAASPTVLASLGFTAAELANLAQHYSAGTSLWRVPLKHFCTFDWNWYGIFLDVFGLMGGGAHPLPFTPQDPCKPGCIVGALHQTLGEELPVTGIGQKLDYSSAGFQASAATQRTLIIPVTGAPNNVCIGGTSCYDGLVGVELDIYVAGEHIVQNFPPQPNQTYTFIWDGKDGYGREVYGSVPVNIIIRYFTATEYVYFHPLGTPGYEPPEFGYPEWSGNNRLTFKVLGGTVSVDNPAGPYYLTNTPQGQGIAPGWDLSSDAWYDAIAGVVHQGDGSAERASLLPPVVVPLTSSNQSYSAIVVGPDGTTYAAQSGAIFAVAGGGGAAQPFATLGSGAQIGTLRMGGNGTLYALDTANNQIDAVTPDGVVTTAATNLQGARSFDLLSGGGFVVAECGQIVQVGADGSQTTVAGKGCATAGNTGDGGFAMDAEVDPVDVIVDPRGDIYFLQSSAEPSNGTGYFLRRILGADGTIATQFLSGTPINKIAMAGSEIALASAGHITFVDYLGNVVNETGTSTAINPPLAAAGAPASNVALNALGLALAPDGSIEVADANYGLVHIRTALPVQYSGQYAIPSSDGSVVQGFDAFGRLQQVVNSLGGATLETYHYNAAGQLVGEADAFGRTLVIARDGLGNPTGIISPDGQTTQLTIGSNGNLVSVADPAGDTWTMGYQGVGLLTSYKDPLGNTDNYTYDNQGRLIQVQEPNGGGWQITRSDTGPASFNLSLKSGEGRVTQYAYNPSGLSVICDFSSSAFFNSCFQTSLQITAPDGTVTSETDPSWGGVSQSLNPDGSSTTEYSLADPRFGTAVAMPFTQVTIPNSNPLDSLTSLTQVQRSVTFGGNGLLDVANLTQTTSVNGQVFTNVYDGVQRTWTSKTPLGRSSVTHINALGQLLELDVPGLASIDYTYDSAGRLSTVTQGSGAGSRAASYAYYSSGLSQGFLQSVTDPIGRTVGYQYDGAGRVTLETLPDGEQIQFGYDADGNLTSLTPPSRPAHGFGYTAVNDVANYIPPAVSGLTNQATQYAYNLDRQLTTVTRPDGETINLGYDSGGRLSSLAVPTGAYTYSYTPTTGQLASVTAPDGEGLNYSWNAFLPTGTSWSGSVAGSVTFSYDNNFRVNGVTVDGGRTIGYGYDLDGLLMSDGDMAIARDATNGLITGTTQGNISSSITYDAFGEPTSEAYSAPVSTQFSLQLALDQSSVTSTTLNITGAVPASLPAGSVITVADAPALGSPSQQSYPIGTGGQFSGTFPLQTGNNSLTVQARDPLGNVIASAQTAVSVSLPQLGGYSISMLEGFDSAGDMFFGHSSTGSNTPVQYELSAGANTPSQPATLQGAVLLAPAQDGSVYYTDSNAALWHEVNGQSTQVADLSTIPLVYSLTVTPAGAVYVSNTAAKIYSVDGSGNITLVGALTGCSNAFGALVKPIMLASRTVIPAIIAISKHVSLHSSAYGLTAGCQGSTGEAVYLFNPADGSSSVLASNTTTYSQYALGAAGEVCFIDGSGQSIDCQNTDGSTATYAVSTTPQDLELDASGNLYYLGADQTVSGDENIYLVSGQSATALLSDQSSAPPVQGNLTISAVNPVTVGGAAYSVTYTRDNVGRIRAKTETINGVNHSYSYGYDQDGRLNSATIDGATTTYGYDANGNRTQVNGAAIATYDDQDRLLTYGSNSYTYTANGELLTKTDNTGTTNYTYDVLGNLLQVQLPNGNDIQYIVDGQNRRVGKRVNGTLTQGFLYQNQLNPVAELDGSGNVVQQYVYGSRSNAPDYIIQGSNTYRIVTDQIGSVRLVADSQTGRVIEEIDYDAWGNVINDTNPGFQPFGFAGGIYDLDTHLVRFGARDYDSTTGRWMSKDPGYFGGSDTDLYGYTTGNPVNAVDVGGYCTKKCFGTAEFTAVGPNQANAPGALPGINGHQNGGAAISPAVFGIPFPEGGNLTSAQLGQRSAAQQKIADAASQISIQPIGMNPDSEPEGTPIGPYSPTDVGDKTVRTNPIPQFDIYGFPTEQDALKFGRQDFPTLITVPSDWPCPKGFIELP